ncbi:MAG: hypothetical protein FJ279_25920 [Planctomycetes bacterium]|nr:hypothetical protein [Planctomycetota bacterium]MBM4085449.1 hypothetical protein [Planctomycetota bacterium]
MNEDKARWAHNETGPVPFLVPWAARPKELPLVVPQSKSDYFKTRPRRSPKQLPGYHGANDNMLSFTPSFQTLLVKSWEMTNDQ